MLKQFIPDAHLSISREKISQFFRAGDFHNAFSQLKKAEYQLDEFQDDILLGARKMLISNRASELLGYINKYRFKTQYEIKTLLLGAFDAGDYHGFLKNIFRFELYKGLENEIENSIDHLLKKGQITDAQAWRRKIDSLKDHDKI